MVLRNEKDSVVKRVGVRVILYQELDLRMNMKTNFFLSIWPMLSKKIDNLAYVFVNLVKKKLSIWPMWSKFLLVWPIVVQIYCQFGQCGQNLLSVWPMWSTFILNLANMVNIYCHFVKKILSTWPMW